MKGVLKYVCLQEKLHMCLKICMSIQEKPEAVKATSVLKM